MSPNEIAGAPQVENRAELWPSTIAITYCSKDLMQADG